MINPRSLQRRMYQQTIFMKTAKSNSLVVLPTGLGKTVIGLLVGTYRLSANPKSKILFLAPTRPLVEQHLKTFRELVTFPAEDLVLLTGQVSPEVRARQWVSGQIFFATPQVVENDLIMNRINLSEFSLIIFDEAHRAVGNYAYVFIAEEYVRRSKQAQILALTASPGAEKEKIQEVCKNLHIAVVEIRTDTSPDVRPYIQTTEVEWRRVQLPPKFKEVKVHFERLFADQIRTIQETGVLEDVLGRKSITRSTYISRRQLLAVQKRIRLEMEKYASPPTRFFAGMAATATAVRISHALELLETQGLHSLEEYLQRLRHKAQHSGAAKSLKTLIQTPRFNAIISIIHELRELGLDHPKIPEVEAIVSEQIRLSRESRIIIFTQYRDSASLLVDKLEPLKYVVPVRFVGQAARDKDKGLSQKQQSEILEEFRDGLYNVLVATQVAEEGLDIPDCDLVIFYDSVPSGVRFIQRRGRTGRQSKGRVIILMAKGTRDEAYYWSAKRKEKAMKKLLRNGIVSDLGLKQEESDKNQLSLEVFDEDDKTDTTSSTTKQESNPMIIVDHRETASPVVRELVRLNAQVQTQVIPIGDYIVSERVVIERKEVTDFANSVIDGRLFKQCQELKNGYPLPIIILEGKLQEAKRAIRSDALRGALASVLINFQIPVLSSATAEETARLILALSKREQSQHKSTPRIRSGTQPVSDKEIQEYLVAGLPNVDHTLAKRLLTKFGTIKQLTNASVKDLTGIHGIGLKKAQRITDIFSVPYPDWKQEKNESSESEE